MISNGNKLLCPRVSKDVKMFLQSILFSMDFYILHIQGAEIVLGIQWLKTLGPITVDYFVLYVQFPHKNQLVTLQELCDLESHIIEHHQLQKLI